MQHDVILYLIDNSFKKQAALWPPSAKHEKDMGVLSPQKRLYQHLSRLTFPALYKQKQSATHYLFCLLIVNQKDFSTESNSGLFLQLMITVIPLGLLSTGQTFLTLPLIIVKGVNPAAGRGLVKF